MLDEDGFQIAESVVTPARVAELIESTAAISERSTGAVRTRGGGAYAVRNLLQLDANVQALAASRDLLDRVEPVLGAGAHAVRAILFDKTAGANWKVAWHQDLSIAVKQRRDVPGYGPWSVKVGVPHVQPPVAVLRSMLTVRLHLDDCGDENGPLLVLPGSHREGILSPAAVETWRERVRPVACLAQRGDAVLMQPLILHASSPAARPGHRRVVHVEYAAPGALDRALEWYVA